MSSNLTRKLLPIFFVFLSGVVNAQSAFEGFYSQIGAAYESNKIGSDSYTEQGFSLTQNELQVTRQELVFPQGITICLILKLLWE